MTTMKKVKSPQDGHTTTDPDKIEQVLLKTLLERRD